MALTLIAAGALLAWLYLVLLHGRFWRATERLDPAAKPLSSPPAVVAVIPARDEAASIGAVVRAHMAADYPGDFSVLVVDDASSDGTAAIAKAAGAAGAPSARRLDVIAARPLEPGWSGKLNAVAGGVAAASDRDPQADYLLLCDADIVLAPSTLRRLVAKAEAEGLALVSLMSRLDAREPWGALLIPAFVFFFQKLYPFPRANDPKSPVAAAAGGCMLVKRAALAAAGGIEAIRGALIDDCALARLLKRAGGRIWIGLAKEEATSLRDNRRYASVHAMVARSAFTQLRHSWVLLAGCLAGMALLYLAPAAIAFSYPLHRSEAAATTALAAFLLMSLAYFPTVRLYGMGAAATFTLPIAALLYMLMTLDSALAHLRGRGGRWKGRVYQQAE